jgi:hypothetical protein
LCTGHSSRESRGPVAKKLALLGYQVGISNQRVHCVLGHGARLVAIGFVAVWSVLSNFLCTLVLVIMKPFSVGDEIELPAANVRGRVADMSMIFTTLESAPGETVMVPNSTFFQNIFKRRIGAATFELGHQLGLAREPAVAKPPA